MSLKARLIKLESTTPQTTATSGWCEQARAIAGQYIDFVLKGHERPTNDQEALFNRLAGESFASIDAEIKHIEETY